MARDIAAMTRGDEWAFPTVAVPDPVIARAVKVRRPEPSPAQAAKLALDAAAKAIF